MRLLALFFCALTVSEAAGPTPETVAAFDRFIKQKQEYFDNHKGATDFLWLDSHPKEKSLIWLNQSQVIQNEAPEIPDGALQDWLGIIFLPDVTLDHIRDMVLNYADYKYFFKDQISESRILKREGDRFDSFIRIHRRQLLAVVLDINQTAEFKSLDELHGVIACRSTHIGEANVREPLPKEGAPAAEDESPYLWRLEQFWRLEQADNGVYVEVDLISLGQSTGKLKPDRLLRGFQTFPKEFTAGLIEGLRLAFPANHR